MQKKVVKVQETREVDISQMSLSEARGAKGKVPNKAFFNELQGTRIWVVDRRTGVIRMGVLSKMELTGGWYAKAAPKATLAFQLTDCDDPVLRAGPLEAITSDWGGADLKYVRATDVYFSRDAIVVSARAALEKSLATIRKRATAIQAKQKEIEQKIATLGADELHRNY